MLLYGCKINCKWKQTNKPLGQLMSGKTVEHIALSIGSCFLKRHRRKKTSATPPGHLQPTYFWTPSRSSCQCCGPETGSLLSKVTPLYHLVPVRLNWWTNSPRRRPSPTHLSKHGQNWVSCGTLGGPHLLIFGEKDQRCKTWGSFTILQHLYNCLKANIHCVGLICQDDLTPCSQSK